MFIQFWQFWFLRFAFLVAVILIAFPIIRCLAWIMNGKYRVLPVLGWFEKRLDSGQQETRPGRSPKRDRADIAGERLGTVGRARGGEIG